jgi:hypothetical protein
MPEMRRHRRVVPSAPPAASDARPLDNSGQIVGQFGAAFGLHDFLDTGGSFTIIDVPGASSTQAVGTNDSGRIVGVFSDSNGKFHGFLATLEPCPRPVINGGSASPDVLWPPNHKFVDVTINYTETSNCTSACTLSVTRNEPGPNEWIIVDAHHVQLLAERGGNGSGRIYTITITCTNSGGTTTQAVTVLVPHDQGK